MLRTLLIAILCQAALAITGLTGCNSMTVSGPMTIDVDSTVLQDTIIFADPTTASDSSNDYALKITANDVTIRNVLIYHAANGMGIYGYESNNLRLENVKVLAYGNDWGA